MTAYSEIAKGEPGNDFIDLVGRTIRAVARSRNYPPPDNRDHWDEDAVISMTTSFFADPQTPRRLNDLRVRCSDERGLRSVLQSTIRNHLADVGRRTDVGRIVRRFDDVLAADDSFQKTGGNWRLESEPVDGTIIDFEGLVKAASKVEVSAPSNWHQSANRKSPDIDKESAVRLAAVLLRASAFPLTSSTIGQVAARRLGIGQTPLSLDVSGYEPPSAIESATADGAVLDLRASEVLDLLTNAQRVALGRLDLSVVDLGVLLSVSKSTAAAIRNGARIVLKDQLKEEHGGQDVAERVLQLAVAWTDSWTASDDAT